MGAGREERSMSFEAGPSFIPDLLSHQEECTTLNMNTDDRGIAHFVFFAIIAESYLHHSTHTPDLVRDLYRQ
jgi:hypothetical protein